MGNHAFSGRKQASFTEDKTVQNPYSLLNRLFESSSAKFVECGFISLSMAFGCYPENF
jgi:hypothetical protein